MSDKTLILIYGDGHECDLLAVEQDSDVKYWIGRRLEKEGRIAKFAWLVEDSSKIDVGKIISEIENEIAEASRKVDESAERQQYERLKAKFEGK